MLGKRDSDSEPDRKTPPSSPLLPTLASGDILSHENLGLWDTQLAQSTGSTSSPTSSSSSVPHSEMSGSNPDAEAKLNAFNIFFSYDTQNEPAELQAHINTMLNAPRTSSSPAAKNIRRLQLVAMGGTESSGIQLLVDNLLFHGEAAGGEKDILRVAGVHLNTGYLPPPPTPFVKADWGKSLAQPIPDSAIGYIARNSTGGGAVSAPLTNEQERTVSIK